VDSVAATDEVVTEDTVEDMEDMEAAMDVAATEDMAAMEVDTTAADASVADTAEGSSVKKLIKLKPIDED